MNELESVVLAQAVKIAQLETQVTTLLARAQRVERQNEHHLIMRTQQESIIRTLQGDKE